MLTRRCATLIILLHFINFVNSNSFSFTVSGNDVHATTLHCTELYRYWWMAWNETHFILHCSISYDKTTVIIQSSQLTTALNTEPPTYNIHDLNCNLSHPQRNPSLHHTKLLLNFFSPYLYTGSLLILHLWWSCCCYEFSLHVLLYLIL